MELNDDTKIDIELQVAQYLYWDRRCLFYLAKMYTENLRAGEEYRKLKEDEKLNDWIHLLNAKSEEDLNIINTKNPG